MYKLSDVKHFVNINDFQTAIKICDNHNTEGYIYIIGPEGTPVRLQRKPYKQ